MVKFWTVTKDNNRNVKTALFLVDIFITNLGKYKFFFFKMDFKIPEQTI